MTAQVSEVPRKGVIMACCSLMPHHMSEKARFLEVQLYLSEESPHLLFCFLQALLRRDSAAGIFAVIVPIATRSLDRAQARYDETLTTLLYHAETKLPSNGVYFG